MYNIIYKYCFYPKGNAGFRAHFPALFEPVLDGTQNTEEDEGRPEEKADERDVGISVEIQIGRKLREMGDQFQQEHLQLVRVIHFRCESSGLNSFTGVCAQSLWFSLQWFLSRCAMTSPSVISMLHMQMHSGRDDIIFWFTRPVYPGSLRCYQIHTNNITVNDV